MARLAEIESRIASMSELMDVVGAMRSIAAARVQQAQGALEGIREYAEAVGDAIARAVALADEPAAPPAPGPSGARRVILVFCSEHGFVGGFNDKLFDRAEEALADTEGGRLAVIGGRGALLADERGLPVAWTVPMATHAGGVLETARRAASRLYRDVGRGEVDEAAMLYARYRSGGRSGHEMQTLLPLDLAPFAEAARGAPPLHDLPVPVLLEKLVGEAVLAELARAAMESFASENGARLHAMESAHDNIEGKLGELQGEERRLRQEEITTELLDLVTGAEALREAR